MTYRADRARRLGKLLDMTARARQMAREFRLCRIVVPRMTDKAGKPRVLLAAVQKF